MKTLNLTRINIPLNRVVVTTNAREILTPSEIRSALNRHRRGDWGDICAFDAERNLDAFHDGSRIFSAYGQGTRRFWVITDGDLHATTVLLPSDY